MKIRIFAILLVLLAASVAVAQTGSGAGTPVPVEPTTFVPAPSWGTAAESAALIASQAFEVPSDVIAYSNTQSGLFQTTTTSTPDWWAPVYVPSGALVTRLQLQACDTTATGNVLFGMARFNSPAATGSNVTPIGDTGLAATPGCAFFEVPVSTPFTMTNGSNYLLLFAGWRGNFTSANRILSARVFYRLQVSPAPATATFNDVPVGSPFHRFIEALAASGITAGCPGGNYCPNDPVTRGQMAVFLSAALGLHWTP